MTEATNPAPEEQPEGEEPQTPLEQFIFHQRRGLEEFGKAMESLLPPGFKEHTQAAGSEFASGFRVLIDAAIDEIKKASEMENPDGPEAAEPSPSASASDDEDRAGSSGKIKVELDD